MEPGLTPVGGTTGAVCPVRTGTEVSLIARRS